MALRNTDMNDIEQKKEFHMRDIAGRIDTITAVPVYDPKILKEQVKILKPPSNSTIAHAAGAIVDHVYLDYGDDLWPYNITGQAITSNSTGAMPPPLSAGTTYYIIRIGNAECELASSYANALAGTPIHILSSETGIWTIVATGAPVPSLYFFDTINKAWKYATLN